MARKFFFVCAGLFLLVLSYHFGASTAQSQGVGNPPVAAISASGGVASMAVVLQNGDVWAWDAGNHLGTYQGSLFSAPTSSVPQTWGQVKAAYRK